MDAIMESENPELVRILVYAGANLHTVYEKYELDKQTLRSLDLKRLTIADLAEIKGPTDIRQVMREAMRKDQERTTRLARQRQLEDERKSLSMEYDRIGGLFADSKRKKIKARMDEIDQELKRLKE